MVSKLLYAIIRDEDVETLFKCRERYFKEKDWELIRCVQEFYVKNGQLPGREFLESAYGVTLEETEESGRVWLGELIVRYRKNVLDGAIIRAAQQKSTEKKLEVLQKALYESLELGEDGVVKVSDIDRWRIYEENKVDGGVRLSTGNATFDEFSVGYGKADLWTIAGKEGIGKTWLMLQMACWAEKVLKGNGMVLFISCEMDKEECVLRLDALRSRIAYGKLLRGALDGEEEEQYKEYLKGDECRILISDQGFRVEDVEALITVYRPEVVFVDGVHSLAKSMDWKDVFDLTLQLKRITRRHKVPMVVSTHVQTEDAKDRLWSLAYSKGFTRNSDLVGVMFRTPMMDLMGEVGVDWVKIRRGKRCQTMMRFEFEQETRCSVVDMRTDKSFAEEEEELL